MVTSFSIVYLMWENTATSDVKIVLLYEMEKSLQKCQNKKMYMHELFSMSIKNDMIIIQFKFVVLISIKYGSTINLSCQCLFEVWHANFFKGWNIFFLSNCKCKVQLDNLKSEVHTDKMRFFRSKVRLIFANQILQNMCIICA